MVMLPILRRGIPGAVTFALANISVCVCPDPCLRREML